MTSAESNITSNDSDISGLDTRLTSAESNITSNDSDISGLDTRLTSAESNITSNDSDIAGLQAELDASQAGAGLSTAGAYNPNTSATYIATASSLKDADDKLDAAVVSVQSQVTSNDNDITGLQAELDASQAGAGLSANGSYSANTGATYIATASSLADADDKLDAAVAAIPRTLTLNATSGSADVVNLGGERKYLRYY